MQESALEHATPAQRAGKRVKDDISWLSLKHNADYDDLHASQKRFI